MSRSISIILGTLALAALCVFCAGKHSRTIVNKLTGSSQARLAEANFSWAAVAFDGRNAAISGVAPTDEHRQDAINLIESITGVRRVSSELTIGNFVREIRARRETGQIILTGKVPSEDTRETIVTRTFALFPADSLIDNLSLQGGPEDPDWTNAVTNGIELLPHLTGGDLRFVNLDVSLHGRADKPLERDSLRQAFAAILPEGYTSTTEITVPEGLQRLNADQCEAELSTIVKNRRITFASASDKLTPDSSPILEEAVNVAKRCGGVKIEVAGYTDVLGNSDRNQLLSEQRAQAVVDYLAGRGISRAMLVAKGYGSRNPIATNRTSSGRAANRRIQFTIIR